MTTLETTLSDSPVSAKDPVCGMDVNPGRSNLVSVHGGHSYWFCAESCRKAFEADPDRYLHPKPEKRRGWLRRYLDRMAKVNKEQFGGDCPKCH